MSDYVTEDQALYTDAFFSICHCSVGYEFSSRLCQRSELGTLQLLAFATIESLRCAFTQDHAGSRERKAALTLRWKERMRLGQVPVFLAVQIAAL